MIEIAVFCLLITLIMVTLLSFSIAKTQRMVAAVRIQLDFLLEQQGFDAKMVVEQKAMELVKQGNKMLAVKLYRELAGGSLRDAMAAVDALPMGDHNETDDV